MIRVPYQLTREEYDEFSRVQNRLSGRSAKPNPVAVVSYLGAAAGIALLFVGGVPGAEWVAPIILIGTSLFSLAFPIWKNSELADREFARTTTRTRDLELEAGTDGVSLNGPLHRMWYSWSALPKIRETRSLFLLCAGDKNVRVIVPKGCLRGNDLDEFRELIKAPGTADDNKAKGFPVITPLRRDNNV
jgi:hypothetical protein